MVRWLVPLVAVSLLASGCTKHKYPVAAKSFPNQIYVRIVSLSPSTTELLAMLEQERNMIGRTAACDAPETIRDIPIMANERPEIEKIIGFQADLVVGDAHLIDPADAQKLRDQGIRVHLIEINSVDDWVDSVWELANVVLASGTASRRVDEVRSAISRATGDPVVPKPRVLIAMGGAEPWVAGTGTFQADCVSKAGGVAVGPSGNMFVRVSKEQILGWNPQVVFVSDDPQQYYGDVFWRATDAGRTDSIVGVKTNLLLRPGARVANLINAMHREMKRAAAEAAGG
ncbi:MAG: ABC transporter substrate-binding protein [Armatimonadetes bacterium]|nr:ABC transporter substrate-binding protein [Armatimonadota bacterium]